MNYTKNYKKHLHFTRAIIISTVILISYGCSNTTELTLAKNKHEIEETKINFKKEIPTYIKIHKKDSKKLNKKITVSAVNVPLISAISYSDSSFSISPDSGVDLKQLVDIKFYNKSIKEYFKYLSNITNYHIDFIDGIVHVKSFQEKTWNLQTISMEQVKVGDVVGAPKGGASGDGDGGSTWGEILVNLKQILGKDARVLANKQLGNITAVAAPNKIRQANKWMSNMINISNKQVHLKVQIIDIIVDESVGRGIDWNLISSASSKFAIGNGAEQEIDAAGIFSIGTPKNATRKIVDGATTGLINLGKKMTLDVMLQFLRKQGKVKIENQPNITITNGRTASISTGDEFSYIESTELTTNDNGDKIYSSETIRTNVGITIEVTPKVLDDNRIVISVVPTIASLKSFTVLKSGIGVAGESFKTPNIALQSLATQVIVGSGETIHLGGLIGEKIAGSAKNLPGDSVFGFLFNGEQKNLERREVVILITPTVLNN